KISAFCQVCAPWGVYLLLQSPGLGVLDGVESGKWPIHHAWRPGAGKSGHLRVFDDSESSHTKCGCREKVWSALWLLEEGTMRIAVFGAGGIGGYLGAKLAQARAEDVLIPRETHLRAIQAPALFVESPTGAFPRTPHIATGRPEDVGIVDAVILGVKAWDVRTAAAAIRPTVSATTGVLTLQNGVEAPAEVAEVVGKDHVIVGCAMV